MGRSVVDTLLASGEPSVRWKVRVTALGESTSSRRVKDLQREIRRSSRARQLIEGHARLQLATYAKWQGAHWVLATLADLGYPPGDTALLPLRDELLATWLHPRYLTEFTATSRATALGRSGVPVLNGRHRRCGSQQGSALLSVVRLGIEDDRAGRLVERLLHWQWPDGGWNCDRDPAATNSSVYETLLPMRGLAAFGDRHGDRAAQLGARAAAEVLLDRRVLYRRTTGRPVRGEWALLHYPVYWRYDVLAGLKGLAEAGLITDPRCSDPLNLLERKQLPGGGWAAEARYYRSIRGEGQHHEHVHWGGVAMRRMNEWVTADALGVLAAAGRRA